MKPGQKGPPAVAGHTEAARATRKPAAPNTQELRDNGTEALRVMKKLAPNQRGAVALTRLHGSALVCVRHRQDAVGAFRYTTVELLVACHAIAARNHHAVGLTIDFRDAELRAKLLKHGGHWDPNCKLWIVTRKVAAQLGLQSRIVSPDK